MNKVCDRYGIALTMEEKLAILAVREFHLYYMIPELREDLKRRDIIREWNNGYKLCAHGVALVYSIVGRKTNDD
jgi:hypothetical protein